MAESKSTPEAAARLQAALIEGAAEAIIATDEQFNISVWNPAAEKIYGWRADEVIGRPIKDVLPAEFPGTTAQAVETQLYETGSWTGEQIQRRKDGSAVRVLVSTSRLRDHTGARLGAVTINHDITERMRVEEGLRRSDERYKALFERSRDGVYVHDFAGKFLDANSAALEMLGYTAEEIRSLSFTDLLAENQMSLALAALAELRQTGTQKEPTVFRMRRKDGAYVWTETKASVIYQDGQPAAVQGIARPITAYMRMQEALRESEQAARQTAEQLRMVNQIGVTLTAGSSFEQLIEILYEQGRQLGDTAMFFVALYDEATGMARFPLCYRDGERVDFPARDIRTSPGVVGYIIEHRQTLYVPDADHMPPGIARIQQFGAPSRSFVDVPLILNGRVVGVLSMQSHAPNAYTPEQIHALELLAPLVAIAVQNSQLYERAQRERDLAAESEARFRAVVENTNDGIFFADANGIVTYRSPSYKRLNGYADEERIGRSALDVVHPDDLPALRHYHGQLLSQPGASIRIEYRSQHKDGSYRWFETTAQNLLRDPHVQQIVATTRDITERKRAEENIAHRLIMEMAIARAAEVFAAGSDDLTPMLDALGEALGAQRAFVLRFSADGAHLENPHLWCAPGYALPFARFPDYPRAAFPWGETRSSQDIIIPDVAALPPEASAEKAGLQAFGAQSLLLTPIVDAAGRAVGYVGFTAIGQTRQWVDEDIHPVHVVAERLAAYWESLAARERLRRSEERYRALVEQVPGVVFTARLDETASVLYISPQIEKLTGYSPAEWLADPLIWQRLTHPDDQERSRAVYLRSRATGEPYADEYRLLARDGRVVWVRDEGAVIRDAAGQPLSIQGILSDITAQKRAEDQVRRGHEELKALFSASQRFGATLDLDRTYETIMDSISSLTPCDAIHISRFDPETQLIHCADGWSDGQKVDVGEYPDIPLAPEGRGVQSLVIRSGAAMIFDDYPRQRQTGVTQYYVTDNNQISQEVRKDERQPQSCLGVPIKVQGEVAGVIQIFSYQPHAYTQAHLQWVEALAPHAGAALANAQLYQQAQQEIEQRKRAEQEREKLQEQLFQAQKMEAVGRLAGGVAHDFNNQLTAIIGYATFLLDSLETADPRASDARQILEAAERSAGLTRQLLAFSRKQTLQPVLLNLNEEIGDIEKMVRRLIGEDIRLIFVPGAHVGQVRADPTQLNQVVMNLAVNARDAMPDGGALTFETENVTLDEEYARRHAEVQPGRYVMLAISDTGTGMSAEVKAHLFEPFFTTKGVGKGTGLGLATVYGIVKQSGGHITVYSEPGHGTTFRIYLPRADVDAQESEAEAAPARSLRGDETVLVVEDEEQVRQMVCLALRSRGYRVLEANSGEAALPLAAAFSEHIHLLVTDVVLTGMSGRVAAEELTALRPEMKVLYMSGYTDDAIVHHGVLDARMAFISKPFTPTALAIKVRDVLDM